MKNKYLYIETFGCQMNVHDSEQMAALLADIGYKLTDNKKIADLILLNTCSIREKAAHKVFSESGQAQQIQRAKSGFDYRSRWLFGAAFGN